MALGYCPTEKWSNVVCLQMHPRNGDVLEFGTKMVSMEVECKGGKLAYCTKGTPPSIASMHFMGEGVVGEKVICHCDNIAVVEVLNSNYWGEPERAPL